jgi:hypothetical protein
MIKFKNGTYSITKKKMMQDFTMLVKPLEGVHPALLTNGELALSDSRFNAGQLASLALESCPQVAGIGDWAKDATLQPVTPTLASYGEFTILDNGAWIASRYRGLFDDSALTAKQPEGKPLAPILLYRADTLVGVLMPCKSPLTQMNTYNKNIVRRAVTIALS